MNIVFHIGVHGTDDELILKTLLRNRDALHRKSTLVPAPGHYRKLLHDAIGQLRGKAASPDMQQILLDTIVTDEGTKRLILSHENFMSGPPGVVKGGVIYPNSSDIFHRLSGLLPGEDFEFFMALKNPAALVVDALHRRPDAGYETVIGYGDPRDLRWAPVIRRMLPYLGANRLVIWRREDAAYVWNEVLRLMMGMAPDTPFMGEMAMLQRLLTPKGAELMSERSKGGKLSIAERRQLTEDILSEHARPEVMEAPAELPGWTQELIDEITRNYDEDMAEIAALPGVEFITPG